MRPAAINGSNKNGSLTIVDIRRFETRFGISIPREYQKHLLVHNGGAPSPSYFNTVGNTSKVHGDFYGIHNGPEHSRLGWNFEVFSERVHPSMLPIASDPLGNQICIGISGERIGSIYFWDHEVSGPSGTEKISPTFSDFLGSLYHWVDPKAKPVDLALKHGALQEIKRSVEAGLGIEERDENGRTLIERASIHCQPEIIEYLFSQGAHLGNALVLAERNAKYFENHKAVVALLKKLYQVGE